jgi:protein-S-isoprenylcysteine O-methyltransferase Ste14
MFPNGTPLSWTAFFLLVVWRIYWYISGREAQRIRPKTEKRLPVFHIRNLSKYITMLAFGIVGVQLLGAPLVLFPVRVPLLDLVGFLFVLVGLGVACLGRYALGTNWSNCYEYQVKRKQELVTNGIYSYIRHPLYAGIALFFIGSELIVQSYLLFPYLLAFLAAYRQGKWEEVLLEHHFGETYRDYKKRTKMLIPFVI